MTGGPLKNKSEEEKKEIYKRAGAKRKNKFYVLSALDGKVLIKQFDDSDAAAEAAEKNPNSVVGRGRMTFVRQIVKTAWEDIEA